MYGYTGFNLKPNGDDEGVTLDNAEEYIELVTDFCLHTGIRRQMEAFRGGFVHQSLISSYSIFISA